MNNKSITILSVIIALCFCLPLYAWNGSGTYEDPYEIATLQDLQDLATAVNGGASQSGVYFLQTADIDLSSVPSWGGIGTISSDLATTNAFSGDYDGDGYSISGMTIYVSGLGDNQRSKFYGLFGAVENATIANLSVYGKITIKSTANIGTEINIGSVIASAYGNCLFEGLESYVDVYYENPNTTDTTGFIAHIGGVLGFVSLKNNNTWSGLKNHGKIYVNSPYRYSACGVMGMYYRGQNQNATFSGWENYGTISSSSSSSSSSPIYTWISGLLFFRSAGKTLLQNSVNYGNLVATNGLSGISGCVVSLSNGNPSPTISACANYGDIKLINGIGGYQGFYGCVCGASVGFTMNALTNYGNIYVESNSAGHYRIGGVLGTTSTSTSSISSYNYGNLTFVGANTSGTDEVFVGGVCSPNLTSGSQHHLTADGFQNFGVISLTTANKSSSANFLVGGIGGVSSETDNTRYHEMTANNSVNFGELEINVPSDFQGVADISGLVSAYSQAKNDVRINWCYNLGKIKWSGRNVNVGGLMGLQLAETASDEYTHIDHSYSVCSYEGSLDGNYVGSVVGYAKSVTGPITVSNSFGVAINRNLPAFGYFNNAYTNNVKGYAWEEVYRDLTISGFYLPSSKFNQPSKTATFFDLICPMNTEIFPTDTDEAKRLHNAVLVNGYKRYIRTIQQQ